MRDAKNIKSWIFRMVAGVMVLQLVAPGIQGAAEFKRVKIETL